MAPGFAFEVGALPQFLAVAGMLGLGVTLLVLHFESRLNRVFALFLILRGLSMFSATQWQLTTATDPASSSFWVGIFPYFTIAAPLVLAYFVWIYPHPRGGREAPWLPAALVTGSILLLEAVYVFDPSLWGSYAVSESGVLTTVQEGPLIAMLGFLFFMFAVAGFVFARDAARVPPGSQRRSLLLVSLAFTLNALFDGTSTSLLVIGAIDFPAGLPEYLGTLSLVPALAAPGILAAYAAKGEDEELRGQAIRYGIGCVLAVGVSLGTLLISSFQTVFLVATGLIRLALPVLVTYALLRHQLFDIDLKVRWGIERGTVGAVFAGAFFVASEGLEQFVPVDGPLLGVLAAGGIALALKPIHDGAKRMAASILPDASPVEELDDEEGREFYREQARIVWSDDEVTDKERRVLDNLAEKLALPDHVAERIEMEAQSAGGSHDSLIGGPAHA